MELDIEDCPQEQILKFSNGGDIVFWNELTHKPRLCPDVSIFHALAYFPLISYPLT